VSEEVRVAPESSSDCEQLFRDARDAAWVLMIDLLLGMGGPGK
jgi:hypothetical protein